MYGPVIEGKLVRLRPPKPADAETMVGWFEDLEVTRFMLLRFPPSIDQEREWLERMAKSPDDIFWVIEHEGRAVGATAIHQIDWKNGSGTTGTTIGDKSLWGKGLGGEVMQLRCRFAFTQLPLRKLKSGYYAGNEASARAQAAAGYREAGRYRAESSSMARGSTTSSPRCCGRTGQKRIPYNYVSALDRRRRRPAGLISYRGESSEGRWILPASMWLWQGGFFICRRPGRNRRSSRSSF